MQVNNGGWLFMIQNLVMRKYAFIPFWRTVTEKFYRWHLSWLPNCLECLTIDQLRLYTLQTTTFEVDIWTSFKMKQLLVVSWELSTFVRLCLLSQASHPVMQFIANFSRSTSSSEPDRTSLCQGLTLVLWLIHVLRVILQRLLLRESWLHFKTWSLHYL